MLWKVPVPILPPNNEDGLGGMTTTVGIEGSVVVEDCNAPATLVGGNKDLGSSFAVALSLFSLKAPTNKPPVLPVVDVAVVGPRNKELKGVSFFVVLLRDPPCPKTGVEGWMASLNSPFCSTMGVPVLTRLFVTALGTPHPRFYCLGGLDGKNEVSGDGENKGVDGGRGLGLGLNMEEVGVAEKSPVLFERREGDMSLLMSLIR